MKTLRILERDAEYFTAKETPEVIEVKGSVYLSLPGNGSPGTDIFYRKKKAIHHAVQMLEHAFSGTDGAFEAGVLEIFYWYDETVTGFVNIGEFYTTVDLANLRYRMAIKIPEYITAADIAAALAKDVAANTAHFGAIEHYAYTAGKSVQILHKGPFAGELQTLPRLQRFAEEAGYRKSGLHHEIHLTAFERGSDQTFLKTILRDRVITIN
jgi:hypothetical protein